MAVAEAAVAADESASDNALPAIRLETADGDSEPLQLQSLCMNCHETGTTTMLLVDIPHFRELLVASFECPHCDHRNSEVQFAGAFGERGTKHTLKVAPGASELLGRQVVKSNQATVTVPELEFEIPPGTQGGVITTVEGLLSDASRSLGALQEERKAADPVAGAAIEAVLNQLDACAAAERDFTLILDDPAGCSHVEPSADGSSDDSILTLETYERTAEQCEAIGLSAAPELGSDAAGATQADERSTDANWDTHHGPAPVGAPRLRKAFGGMRVTGDTATGLLEKFASPEEVIELPGRCYACGAECDTRMFTTSIPHFKDVIIMSNSCDACGYRDSEVKPGGGFSEQGRSIQLHVREQEDLSRDVIKSDSASVLVEELGLEMSTGSLGGLITTVEGLLTSVQDSLSRTRSFQLGDSAETSTKTRWKEFFERLQKFAAMAEPWTLVIRDPLANSFVAPITENLADDPRLTIESYDRSPSDDEEYGIDHLKLHDDQQQEAGSVTAAESSAAGPPPISEADGGTAAATATANDSY